MAYGSFSQKDMTHKRKRLEPILIAFISWIVGCLLFFVAVYPVCQLIEGQLYQAIDEGARQYEVNGEYLAVTSKSAGQTESETVEPLIGRNYARLIQKDISLDVPVYYGDDEDCLQKGIGQYVNHVVPGESGVILLSGHDSTYLRHIEQLQEGDFLTFQVNDKKFYYVITKTAIEDANNQNSFLFDSKEQELVLYTCYPIGDLTKDRSQRYIIYGKRYIK